MGPSGHHKSFLSAACTLGKFLKCVQFIPVFGDKDSCLLWLMQGIEVIYVKCWADSSYLMLITVIVMSQVSCVY